MEGGKRVWYFPDGYLPEKNPAGSMEAHEALMLFNVHEYEVKVRIDIYYSDRDPVRNIPVTVPAERIIALRITASEPIVVQFGRLDTTQSNMAYYLGVGFCE